MSYSPTIPTTFDICVFEDISLQEISAYIDWSPFFLSWELKGKYPAILHDEIYGKEAQQLFDDAQQLLLQLIESLEPREAEVVIGILSKDLGVKGLNYKFVKEAFPQLLP